MRRIPLSPLALALALAATGCASSRSAQHGVAVERGVASWYGPGFHGNFTASGERYDMWAMTAAHRTLPFGTVVEVRNLENGRSVRVKINDRGPFLKNRVVDLSRAAAEAIDMVGPGTAIVELVAVGLEPLGGFAFTVQVGAFREAAAAVDLAERLRGEFPEVAVRSDEVWSRVQVGSPTRDEARPLPVPRRGATLRREAVGARLSGGRRAAGGGRSAARSGRCRKTRGRRGARGLSSGAAHAARLRSPRRRSTLLRASQRSRRRRWWRGGPASCGGRARAEPEVRCASRRPCCGVEVQRPLR
jgi:rare lipoprotein A